MFKKLFLKKRKKFNVEFLDFTLVCSIQCIFKHNFVLNKPIYGYLITKIL